MGVRQSVVKIYSCFSDGLTGVVSEIEISLSPGLPTFDIIGLCDSSIRESRGRIKAALISSGFYMPKGHITVGISPAYMHKSGSSFDLAVSLGMLFVSNQLSFPTDKRIYAEGELSLNGDLKASPGAAVRLKTHQNDFDYSFIPEEEIDAAKCSNFKGKLVKNLREVADCFLLDSYTETNYSVDGIEDSESQTLDFSCLKGQEKASRAILIAAAGRHNLMLMGSPGCGKTMAGRLIAGIMPPLSGTEISDVYMTREVSGISFEDGLRISRERPFVYVYPGVTSSKLLGNNKSDPGELLRANHGVLFADEICEYKREVIENLRIPLEEHLVRKQKDGKNYSYPISFVFVAAGNPCKCGHLFDEKKRCTCTLAERKNYLKRLSGPFLDRMDLFSEMRIIASNDMRDSLYKSNSDMSSRYREIVAKAWEIQSNRYKEFGTNIFNGTLSNIDADLIGADKTVVDYASDISEKEGFSGRGFTRIMKVARTIADISGRDNIIKSDVSEAVIYRQRINV